ncbi:MAG: hypothetical protein HY774_06390 [Acidobacteria bacterium]|nr:hypothetical protein [Acidobacteriota bacterium]
MARFDLIAARQKTAGASVSLTEDPIVRTLYRQDRNTHWIRDAGSNRFDS